MRSGGGKAKGGAYEHTVAKRISLAMKCFNIHEDDCYRTKNSGATKAQPGDLQLSPALVKFLPATIEAKHYRTIKYKLGRKLSAQPSSYEIHQWWKQVEREQKDAPNKFSLLVMRENNCPDLCAFAISKIREIQPRLHFTRYTFGSLIVTHYKDKEIWIVPFEEFLDAYVRHLKWFILFREFDFRKDKLCQ